MPEGKPNAVVVSGDLEAAEDHGQPLVGVALVRELLYFSALAVLAYSVCFLVVAAHKDFWNLVSVSGENRGYIRIAQGIHDWSPQLIGKVKLFWGTSYGILAVRFLGRTDYVVSLFLLSVFCGVLGIVFAYRLYGRTVAACFVFISPVMMQRTLVGGSEPLFVALFLGSFLAVRKGFPVWGVLLGALASTVRPIGVFVVAAILLGTLRRRDWGSFVRCVAVAACVAALYAGPLVLLTGSPFGNFSGYAEDWHQKFPITIPFYPLITAAFSSQQAPMSNSIKIAAWIAAVLFVVVYYGLLRGRLRARHARHPEETVAVLLILLFQFSYNSGWAWIEFPRFIAPVVPFLLALAGVERIRQGWLLAAAPVFGLAGAVQIVGLQRLLQSFRGSIGL